MVDVVLPFEARARPLRYLFLDLNSYFASVEQQERPELRGRPVAVVPVMADSSFVIAASYEAKAFGVKCGVRIGEAKRMCPGIDIVMCRPQVYMAYHNRVVDVVNEVLPVEEVRSVDEMYFRLLGEETHPERATQLAQQLKKIIRDKVGSHMGCSIGIAPNVFLAKVGTEMQKPDGLVVLEHTDLPGKLYKLKLTDFAGINRRMSARLNAAGIFTVEQMCAADRHKLTTAFGSVMGERWYYLLRGHDLPHETTDRRTLSQSHVLPPELRTDQGSREVMLRLLQKASMRLRKEGLWTTCMDVSVTGVRKSWSAKAKLPPTQDSMTFNEAFLDLWKGRDFVGPKMVAICFSDLRQAEEVTPSLFDATVERSALSHAVDGLNMKFGKNRVYIAGMEHAKDAAEERIAFQKTWLLQEGKGDNDLESLVDFPVG